MIPKLVGLNRLQSSLKNIYSAIVHTNDTINPWHNIKHTSVIGMGLQTPKFPLDFELYQHFRDTCNSVITTANILKLEANYLEQIRKKESQSQKNYLVLSKSLSNKDILTLPFYRDQSFNKTIPITENINLDSQLCSFQRVNRINFCQNNEVNQMVKQFQNNNKNDNVYFSMGPRLIQEMIDEIDLFVLTLYRGQLDQQFQAGQMPSFDTILDKFTFKTASKEFDQHKGVVQFLVFQKK